MTNETKMRLLGIMVYAINKEIRHQEKHELVKLEKGSQEWAKMVQEHMDMYRFAQGLNERTLELLMAEIEKRQMPTTGI